MGTPDEISSPPGWNRVSPGCPSNFYTDLTEPTRQIKTTFPTKCFLNWSSCWGYSLINTLKLKNPQLQLRFSKPLWALQWSRRKTKISARRWSWMVVWTSVPGTFHGYDFCRAPQCPWPFRMLDWYPTEQLCYACSPSPLPLPLLSLSLPSPPPSPSRSRSRSRSHQGVLSSVSRYWSRQPPNSDATWLRRQVDPPLICSPHARTHIHRHTHNVYIHLRTNTHTWKILILCWRRAFIIKLNNMLEGHSSTYGRARAHIHAHAHT